MTIHIDPNADIIQQLNDLFPILSVKEVNVVVSEEQLKAVKSNIHCAAYWAIKDMPSDSFAVRIGAVQFNLTTSQRIGTDPIHLTTPPTSTRPDAASGEGHTDK